MYNTNRIIDEIFWPKPKILMRDKTIESLGKEEVEKIEKTIGNSTQEIMNDFLVGDESDEIINLK